MCPYLEGVADWGPELVTGADRGRSPDVDDAFCVVFSGVVADAA
jgi:hypothetical protein